MTALTLSDIGSLISFSVWPSSVLGTLFDKAKLLTFLDEDTAKVYIDTAAMHANVYSTLPIGTPNNPASYQYVKLKLQNGDNVVIGVPWINESTIVRHSGSTIVITIPDSNPNDDVSKVRQALLGRGFTKFTIAVS